MDDIKKLIETEQYSEAKEILHKLEAENPNKIDVLYWLGKANYNNYHESERYYRKILKIDPTNARVHLALHDLLIKLRRYDEVRILRATIIELVPELTTLMNVLNGMTELSNGNYLDGWELYHERMTLEPIKPTYFTRWGGESLIGKTILIRDEEGFGDQIQCIRFISELKKLGAYKIGFLCHSQLHRLFKKVPNLDFVMDNIGNNAFHYEVFMYSIPYMIDTTLETLPSNPIIDLPIEDTEKWNKILKDLDKPKIGIAWAGNSKNPNDKQRSITLEQLRPVFDVDCYFFALQKGERQKDIEEFTSFRKIHDVMNAMHDFYDTACFINELDLVIAVDTSTAHLAGLLNKPVWLLSKYEICWRWLKNRTDSPWYPSLKIYSQHTPFEWNGVLSEVSEDLEIWCKNYKKK